MITDGSSGSIADAAVLTGNRGGGWGDMGGAWLIIVLLALFGWGNGGIGGGAGMMPWMVAQGNNGADVQRGFDQAAIMGQLSGIQTSIAAGNAAAEANAANRQIAGMQQDFNSQIALMQQLNAIAGNQQQCCCDNRAAIADLKNAITQDGALTRQAIATGVQSVHDKLCQLELDNYKRENANLQNKLNIAEFNSSQNAQNNYLQNALTAQTQYILGLYPPTATAARTATTQANAS